MPQSKANRKTSNLGFYKMRFESVGGLRASFVGWMLATSMVLFLVASLALAGCGEGETPTATPTSTPGQATVNISGFAFVPQTLTVAIGTEVVWVNNDSVPHTVTSRDNVFDSGNLPRGASFRYTFNQIGTFDYYCTIHPSMTGKIVVE